MRIKDSEIYRPILESELRRHTSHRFDLLIEEDLARWAAERQGDLQGNPPAHRQSMVKRELGEYCYAVR